MARMSPDEHFHIKNLDKLVDVLNRQHPKRLWSTVQTIMRVVVIKAVARTRRNAPVWTGELRRTIGHEVKAPMGAVLGIVGSPKEYAPYVEQPGRVRRTGRRPFLRPAIEEHIPEVARDFERGLARLWKQLGF